jgi:ABC-type phosphate/phosphonate transport system substrate-binding protein
MRWPGIWRGVFCPRRLDNPLASVSRAAFAAVSLSMSRLHAASYSAGHSDRGAAYRSLRAALLVLVLALPAAAAEISLTFVGVALDAETSRADERLREYLRSRDGFRFEPRDLDHGAAVDLLVSWDARRQGPLLARVPPFVYLAAEMLGANLDVLATGVSPRVPDTTRLSHFVVRRGAGLQTADPDALLRWLRERTEPARFVYPHKFSTSGYVLPAAFFRRAGVFTGPGPNGSDQRHTFIRAEQRAGGRGAAELVGLVRDGRAELAAVWDGVRARFAEDPDLLFIPLPFPAPNDLLVFASGVERSVRDRLAAGVRAMRAGEIGGGDTLRWQDFNAAPEARRALATLRRQIRGGPPPVPIRIRGPAGGDALPEPALLEAARQAVLLAGTEFTLYDEDFHKHFDVLWTLRRAHDDAVVLTSEYSDFGLPPQEFHLSYRRDDPESLVGRLEDCLSNRMHRVREVWSFDDRTSTVLRDVRFALPPGTRLPAVRVVWNDSANNDRAVGSPFVAEVAAGDFHAFRLKPDGFPRRSDGARLDLDPLGSTSYRVALVRPVADTFLFRLGTSLVIVLAVLAAVLALWTLVRRPGGPAR